MANLAQDWDAFREYEKEMIRQAVDWSNGLVRSKKVEIALLPFLARKTVQGIVDRYVDHHITGNNPKYEKWHKLRNYLKFGPYVRRWK